MLTFPYSLYVAHVCQFCHLYYHGKNAGSIQDNSPWFFMEETHLPAEAWHDARRPRPCQVDNRHGHGRQPLPVVPGCPLRGIKHACIRPYPIPPRSIPTLCKRIYEYLSTIHHSSATIYAIVTEASVKHAAPGTFATGREDASAVHLRVGVDQRTCPRCRKQGRDSQRLEPQNRRTSNDVPEPH